LFLLELVKVALLQPINIVKNITKIVKKKIPINKSKGTHTNKLAQMFKYPLAICYAKPGKPQADPDLKHLRADIDDWGKFSKYKKLKISLIKYLLDENSDNELLSSAIKLVLKYGSNTIIELYEYLKKHKKVDCALTLTTAHSSKGLTFDEVELAPDMDKCLIEVIGKPKETWTEEDVEIINLYFVAITRHRYNLIGANYLLTLQ
jgi:superfamily I DNA/RNA helicase